MDGVKRERAGGLPVCCTRCPRRKLFNTPSLMMLSLKTIEDWIERMLRLIDTLHVASHVTSLPRPEALEAPVSGDLSAGPSVGRI